MNLKGQHIGRFFTYLAGLIIFAHAVVPHHHHFESTHSPVPESTCENPVQENSNEDPVSHCYAFNILVSERILNSSVNQPISENFLFCFVGDNTNIELWPVKNITTTFFCHSAVFIKQFFFSAHLLRAPPAFA